MEQLMIYASSDSESNSPPRKALKTRGRSTSSGKTRQALYTLSPIPPPPPPELESIPNALPDFVFDHGGRKRSFPHVDGNFPVHLSIPVHITPEARTVLEQMLGKASQAIPDLRGMDDDILMNCAKRPSSRSNAGSNIEIAREYHISLSRTVPIRVHQIETLVPMLRHKFEHQTRFWIEFGRWGVFLNDEKTRTFLALEVVTGGRSEIRKQIRQVTQAFKLHGLPPFYEPARPHISVAYAVGDISSELEQVAAEMNELGGNTLDYRHGLVNVLWSHLFGRIDCKIGQQTYPIWVASTATHT